MTIHAIRTVLARSKMARLEGKLEDEPSSPRARPPSAERGYGPGLSEDAGQGGEVEPATATVISSAVDTPAQLHPDGRRFLFARIPGKAPAPPVTRLTVVHNWFAELERLSPISPTRR